MSSRWRAFRRGESPEAAERRPAETEILYASQKSRPFREGYECVVGFFFWFKEELYRGVLVGYWVEDGVGELSGFWRFLGGWFWW